MERRLAADLRRTGDFSRIHIAPKSGADIQDDQHVRLVVLGTDSPFTKEPGNPAELAAKAMLETRGNTPRLYRNTLVFLAADKVRLQDLDDAVRKFLAWESILSEKDTLDLSPFQVRQAETQRTAAEGAVVARLPETYQWLLVPVQSGPQAAVEWQSIRLSGSDALAVRAGKKLRSDELLVGELHSTILRKYLDEVPLWRGANQVSVRQLVDDFTRYLYLPRLIDPSVLLEAVRSGVALLSWARETFAYAEGYDEKSGKYTGLRGGQSVFLGADSTGLLVRPEVAQAQLDDVSRPVPVPPDPDPDGPTPGPIVPPVFSEPPSVRIPQQPALPRRFYGSVALDPTRVGRDAGRLAEEVIAHLAGLLGSEVKVTLEIEAQLPNGATEQVVRVVMENSKTLKFGNCGFEQE